MRGARLLLGFVLLAVGLGSSACQRRSRSGETCDGAGSCAVGLTCHAGYCLDPDAPTARGLRLSARKFMRNVAPPGSNVRLPDRLQRLASQLSAEVRATVHRSPTLPQALELGGTTVRPRAAAELLDRRLALLAERSEHVRYDGVDEVEPGSDPPEGMARVPTPGSEAGEVVAGAVMEAEAGRRVIHLVGTLDDVDDELARVLWQLRRLRDGGLAVGFLCAGDAFCPRPQEILDPPEDGGWTERERKALQGIYRRFERIRGATGTALRRKGLEPVAVDPASEDLDEQLDGLASIVWVSPLRPPGPKARSWLERADERAGGPNLVALLPGARYRASNRRIVPVAAAGDALLELLGLRRAADLLRDEHDGARLRVPAEGDDTRELPLTVRARAAHPGHAAAAGLPELHVPLAGTLAPAEEGAARPLLVASGDPEPAMPPAPARADALAEADGGEGEADAPRMLAATAEPDQGRTVVIRSALGLVARSADGLLRDIAPAVRSAAGDPEEVERRLEPYAEAAKRYQRYFRLNQEVRREALTLLGRAASWVAVPPSPDEDGSPDED